MKEILEILEKDSKLTAAQIASRLNMDENTVASIIKKLEEDKVILGYPTLINWDKTDRELITAFIDLKIIPQRGNGFDKVAARIYKFPEVTSLYLMSAGGYDLSVTIEGKTMKEVAMFVAERLAPMESVVGTATHFVLKKYKSEGMIFENDENDDRRVITL